MDIEFNFVASEVKSENTTEIKKCVICKKEIFRASHKYCKNCWMKFIQPQFNKKY